MIELRRPDPGLHREWLDFVSDYDRPGVDGGSIGNDELTGLADAGTFASWVSGLLDQEVGRNIPEDRVPCTSRWIVREGEIVGVINLRHELNDLLLAWGGHIGYAVRVSARRQGIATRALALMLGEAARLGINPVLVTCDEDNVGSRATIEGAGGVYDGSVEGKRRYWITLADTPIGYAVRPLSLDPLRGRLVTLRLATKDEASAMHAGRHQPDWAEGFPREDDLDGTPVRDLSIVADPEWSTRLIVRRLDNRVIGTIGFYGPPDPSDPASLVEVGYGMVESARGQGLITDALRLLVPAALARAVTIQAHAAYENGPSRRALERAGFTHTGETDIAGHLRFVRARG
ncbi:MAG TPA: GNAT family N-acetyltransferase [Dermatophilaceae bacterium]|jgi:predicted acetyltransferase|nr:GNAT family N-acetyltransferase [Dermatophilaceae bacterium]